MICKICRKCIAISCGGRKILCQREAFRLPNPIPRIKNNFHFSLQPRVETLLKWEIKFWGSKSKFVWARVQNIWACRRLQTVNTNTNTNTNANTNANVNTSIQLQNLSEPVWLQYIWGLSMLQSGQLASSLLWKSNWLPTRFRAIFHTYLFQW